MKMYIFLQAVLLLKPSGTLVYSTCTITLAENEGIVAWTLRNFDDIALMPSKYCLGETGWPGTTLTDVELEKVQRFGPHALCDSVGFFFAIFRKKSVISTDAADNGDDVIVFDSQS